MITWPKDTNMSDVRLLYNALQTPDGTILTSRNSLDYVSHVDENGKNYFTDGGLEYMRCSANGDEVHLCVWSDDDHEVIRERAEWGTYGKDGDKPLNWVKLKDIETDHLKTVIRQCQASKMHPAFVAELSYRNDQCL